MPSRRNRSTTSSSGEGGGAPCPHSEIRKPPLLLVVVRLALVPSHRWIGCTRAGQAKGRDTRRTSAGRICSELTGFGAAERDFGIPVQPTVRNGSNCGGSEETAS